MSEDQRALHQHVRLATLKVDGHREHSTQIVLYSKTGLGQVAEVLEVMFEYVAQLVVEWLAAPGQLELDLVDFVVLGLYESHVEKGADALVSYGPTWQKVFLAIASSRLDSAGGPTKYFA
jgi:hypothetical protein